MSKSIKLTKDPIWTLLRKVTIPASVGSLFQTFYNLVDTWFAGRISAEAIGAIAKSFPIYFTIIAVGVGLGAATNALIGNSIGEKVDTDVFAQFADLTAQINIAGGTAGEVTPADVLQAIYTFRV